MEEKDDAGREEKAEQTEKMETTENKKEYIEGEEGRTRYIMAIHICRRIRSSRIRGRRRSRMRRRRRRR